MSMTPEMAERVDAIEARIVKVEKTFAEFRRSILSEMAKLMGRCSSDEGSGSGGDESREVELPLFKGTESVENSKLTKPETKEEKWKATEERGKSIVIEENEVDGSGLVNENRPRPKFDSSFRSNLKRGASSLSSATAKPNREGIVELMAIGKTEQQFVPSPPPEPPNSDLQAAALPKPKPPDPPPPEQPVPSPIEPPNIDPLATTSGLLLTDSSWSRTKAESSLREQPWAGVEAAGVDRRKERAPGMKIREAGSFNLVGQAQTFVIISTHSSITTCTPFINNGWVFQEAMEFLNDGPECGIVGRIDYNPFLQWKALSRLKDCMLLQIFSAMNAGSVGTNLDSFGKDGLFPGLVYLGLSFHSFEGGLLPSFFESAVERILVQGQKVRSKLSGTIVLLQHTTSLKQIWVHGVVNLTNNYLQGSLPKFVEGVNIDNLLPRGNTRFCTKVVAQPCSPLVDALLFVAEHFGYPLKPVDIWEGTNPCVSDWMGIVFSGGNISIVNFKRRGLFGSIFPRFATFTWVTKLFLANNNLMITLPKELASMHIVQKLLLVDYSGAVIWERSFPLDVVNVSIVEGCTPLRLTTKEDPVFISTSLNIALETFFYYSSGLTNETKLSCIMKVATNDIESRAFDPGGSSLVTHLVWPLCFKLWDPGKPKVSMLVNAYEDCLRNFPTFYGLLNVVYDRGKICGIQIGVLHTSVVGKGKITIAYLLSYLSLEDKAVLLAVGNVRTQSLGPRLANGLGKEKYDLAERARVQGCDGCEGSFVI